MTEQLVEYVSVKEAARRFGVHEMTIRRAGWNGKLPDPTRVGAALRYDWAELQAAMKRTPPSDK